MERARVRQEQKDSITIKMNEVLQWNSSVHNGAFLIVVSSFSQIQRIKAKQWLSEQKCSHSQARAFELFFPSQRHSSNFEDVFFIDF